MKIIILGAGASIGSKINTKYRPPSVYDFFKGDIYNQLKLEYKELFSFLEKLNFPINRLEETNIEQLFTSIEPYWRMNLTDIHNIDNFANKYGKEIAYVNPLIHLKSYVIDYILLSTQSVGKYLCEYHNYLIDKIVEPNDLIISFNYDLIIDHSLKKSKKISWNEFDGYNIYPYNYYDFKINFNSEVKLLKLHGSLNFYKHTTKNEILNIDEDKMEIDLVNDYFQKKNKHFNSIPALLAPNYAKSIIKIIENISDENSFIKNSLLNSSINSNDNTTPFIIYPTINKPFEELSNNALKPSWKLTEEMLGKCQEILAIGFSFNDNHFNQLFEMGLLNNSNKINFTIVNSLKEKENIQRKFSHIVNLDFSPFYGFFEQFIKYRKNS